MLFSFSADACRPTIANLKALNNSSATMVLSGNKKYLLRMTPPFWEKKGRKFIKLKEPVGRVSVLKSNGELRYLWNSKNIFPTQTQVTKGIPTISRKYYEILISNDGNYVVKIREYGNKSTESSFATDQKKDFITVINRGKILHQFSYSEFVGNKSNKSVYLCGGKVLLKGDIKLKNNYLYFELFNGDHFKVNIVTGTKPLIKKA